MKAPGKNVYLWQPLAIFGSDTARIAEAVKDTGFESVILHTSQLSTWRSMERIDLVQLLKQAGIQVWAGAAVYGVNPEVEGCQAASICEQYNLDGFVFDAEQTFDDKPKSDTNAVKMLKAFRKDAPDRSVGWCWWARYKSPVTGIAWHPKKVLWAAMTPNYGDADFGMPMCYWEGENAANAIKLLDQTFGQWRSITDKPIVPIGRAYIGDGGTAIPEAIAAFDQHARSLGAPGISWWSMQHAIKMAPVWEALRQIKPFGAENAPAPELTLAEKVDLLWAHHKELWNV